MLPSPSLATTPWRCFSHLVVSPDMDLKRALVCASVCHVP